MSQWTDRELAELEAPDTWDRERRQVVDARAPARAVLAVPFEGDEYQALAQAARRAGKPTTQFVHDLVMAALRG